MNEKPFEPLGLEMERAIDEAPATAFFEGEAGREKLKQKLREDNTRRFLAGDPALSCKPLAAPSDDFAARVRRELQAIGDMLIAKNKAYGNSALDPVRIFSRASADEQIRVRLDDKLSRLARGHAADEDVELDLVGYIVLLRLARQMAGKGGAA